MLNLFAYRATKPVDMKVASDPIGPENDWYLARWVKPETRVVAAWGRHGKFMNRDLIVQEAIPDIHALAINKDGTPKHPLYVKGDTIPEPYIGRLVSSTEEQNGGGRR